jgi:hypothetical protein
MQRQQIPGLFRMWRSRESRRKPKGVWLRSAAKPSREAAAPQSTFSVTVSARGQLGAIRSRGHFRVHRTGGNNGSLPSQARSMSELHGFREGV